METDDFFNKIKNNFFDSVQLSAIVLEILEVHLKEQNKKLTIFHKLKDSNNSSPYDAIAFEGFDNFQGKTALEIKIINNPLSTRESLRKSIKKIKWYLAATNQDIENYIFVFPREIPLLERVEFADFISDPFINIIIWDQKDLKIIFDKYPDLLKQYDKHPAKAVFNQKTKEIIYTLNNLYRSSTVLNNERKNDQSSEHLKKLKNCFNNDGLALFLGAGTSIKAKIPKWDNLISNLMVSLVDNLIEKNKGSELELELSILEKDLLIESIKEKSSTSPLQLVRFIRNGLGESFREELRNILYADCDSNTSDLLRAITDLSVPLRNRTGLQGIITYNFDDLLEKNFTNKNVINFRSIYNDTDAPSKKELPIYHVHGYLPRLSANEGSLEEEKTESDFLVFSEEGYHELILDPYHWANLIQLNFFKEHTCLFVGVSMTDPNIRRLLEISNKKSSEAKHFIIFERQSFKNIQNKKDANKKNIQLFAEVHQSMKEEELRELGLNILWVDSYDEIPELLDELRR